MIATVIRHLPNYRPVTLCVIRGDTARELEDYAEKEIEEFKNQFIEFRRAEFYIDVTEEDLHEI